MTPSERQLVIVEFLEEQIKPLLRSRFTTDADKKRLEDIEKFIGENCLPLLDTKGHDYTAGNVGKGEEPVAGGT